MAGIIEIPQIVPELLLYREAPLKDCEDYKKLYHDSDLCPTVERQLRAVLDGFLKYSAVAYDVQGFNDRGTDVLLRFFNEGNEEHPWRFIAFQIKSYHDLQTDRYLWKNLKSQYFEALAEYGAQLENYFILVCTTYNKKEMRKLRWIKKTFSTITNATVIDPAYVLTFLRMSSSRINITIESLLRDEDIVFRRARELLQDAKPPLAALIVTLCEIYTRNPFETVTLEDLVEYDFLAHMYNHLPDFDATDYEILAEQFVMDEYDDDEYDQSDGNQDHQPIDRQQTVRERIAEDVESLLGDSVIPEGENRYRITCADYYPLGALLLDARSRYGYERSQLSEYVFTSLKLLELYGLEYPSTFELVMY